MDRLLASEQHGVRYARHWLDVLRYADADERMIAAPGIHLWRDWVINALNDDMPYDQFVRAPTDRLSVNDSHADVGHRLSLPRGAAAGRYVCPAAFCARSGDSRRQGRQELAIAAVETVTTAFMGLTVGCAKCHDHMYDPISSAISMP